jgi:hypothetical protein
MAFRYLFSPEAIMQSLWSIGFGLLSGVAGWMISEFLAKPFRRGIDLVAEARTSIIVYANVQARARMAGTSGDGVVSHVELPDDAEARLRKAEEMFRELGARMQAFAATDRPAARVLRALGTDLSLAGVALIGLSNSVGVYGHPRHDAQRRVATALGVNE